MQSIKKVYKQNYEELSIVNYKDHTQKNPPATTENGTYPFPRKSPGSGFLTKLTDTAYVYMQITSQHLISLASNRQILKLYLAFIQRYYNRRTTPPPL